MSDYHIDLAKLEDWQGWFQALGGKTADDITAAVLGASRIDATLGAILEAAFVDTKEARKVLNPDKNGALMDIMARARVAYGMALIGGDDLNDIKYIARIRNAFAHGQHGMKFEDGKVPDDTAKLRSPDTHPLMGELADTPRMRYVVACIAVAKQLYNHSLPKARNRREPERSSTVITMEEVDVDANDIST